jgi:hypothetical protein
MRDVRSRKRVPASLAGVSPARSIEMQKTHPHAEASYRVIPLENGSFGVEVSIPDTHPTTVSMFKTEADAEAWIAEHRRRVQSQTQSRRWFGGSRGRDR